ncbi:uncharacterized protein LOC114264968 [Camellia sinensis]|uniref:uncharacterized protein LOC114264968 n=1 Tax=Camellia sinensis TaxID=4442 RepID=UPI0010368771|nr:uncharacterized protein LOC114264968 [Camellia sinensis]
MDFMVVDAEGSVGGLLCIWNPDIFQMSEYCSNQGFIIMSGTFFNLFEYTLLNIYAPNEMGARGEFWERLVNLKNEFPKPWCIAGDFNEIRSIGEKKGCSRRDKGMKELNEFIDKCEVVDLPLLDRKFTWCNSTDGEKWSRIDRVLVDPSWHEVFNLKLWRLPRVVSDHCPLLLMEDERDWGPKPFRVLNAWLLHREFQAFVEKNWNKANVVGWAGYILCNKLKTLNIRLKKWNVEIFGNVINKLKSAEADLHQFDLLAEDRGLNESEKVRRRDFREKVWRLNRMVE